MEKPFQHFILNEKENVCRNVVWKNDKESVGIYYYYSKKFREIFERKLKG